MKYLLPGIMERTFAVTALHMNVQIAIRGMARTVGTRGSATSPPMKSFARGARNSRCIRYIPYVRRAVPSTDGRAFRSGMHVNITNSPKVARSTLGVQNSQDHSSIGVSMVTPGTPFHQKDHAVNAAPARKHMPPVIILFLLPQSRWKRM